MDGTDTPPDDDTGEGGPPVWGNQRRRRKGKKNALIRKFKAAAWMAVLIRRLCKDHIRNNEDGDSPYMRNVQFADGKEQGDNPSGLMFDVGLFKAKREMRMSEESKRILAAPRWARTETDILHLEIVLRTIKDYASYPVSTQRQIAEVGQYVKYEARRIIVRQGHPAWNFYFILSGAVVVLVMDGEQNFVVPKALLRRGQSFGELALISGGRRMSTVVATEDLEMLSIWHEDFKRIFDNGGIKKSEDEFIKNLFFFQGWPLQIADVYPQRFIYHYYKRGEVVVKDSRYSTWIIVVKSGSLDVMKKLCRARPRPLSPIRPPGFSPLREAWDEGNFKSVVDCRWRRMSLQPKKEHNDSQQQPQPQRKGSGRSGSVMVVGLPDLPPPAASPRHACQHGLGCRCHLIRSSSAQPMASGRRSHLRSAQQRPRTGVRERTNAAQAQTEQSDASALPRLGNRSIAINANGILDVENIAKSNFTQEIRTAAGDLDKEIKSRGENGPAKPTEADTTPMFVRVQTLTKGQVFGLTDLVLGAQPTFSVISNGAECIMIEKSLYVENANEGLLKVIRDQAQAYPSDEEMQQNLQTAIDWSRYKKETVEQAHRRTASSLCSSR